MKFKQFIKNKLNEMDGVEDINADITDVLSDCKKLIQNMDEDEIDKFGEWLYSELFDDGDSESFFYFL